MLTTQSEDTIGSGTNTSTPEPRVAVVIPAFNAEATLPDCLDSVLGQTEGRIEVVVVDDGSTDATHEVAVGFASADRRVRVLRQPNAGPAAARNRGAAATTAPLLCFFDADDLMPAGKVAAQADHLDRRPGAGVIYSSLEEFEDQGARRITLGRRPDPRAPLHESLLEGGLPCLPSTMMVRRSVFDAIHGFRDGWSVTEDWDFCVRAAIAGVRFDHVAEPAVLYRRHATQRSSDIDGYFEDCARILDHIHAELRATGRRPPERARLRAHWITLMRAAMADRDGRGGRARRLVLRSLRYGHRPGNFAEVARLLLHPRLALQWAGLEDPRERRSPSAADEVATA